MICLHLFPFSFNFTCAVMVNPFADFVYKCRCRWKKHLVTRKQNCALYIVALLFCFLFFCWLFSCSREIKEGQHCFHFSQAYDQPIAIVPIDENKLINHLLKLMIMWPLSIKPFTFFFFILYLLPQKQHVYSFLKCIISADLGTS